jgi:hypothetical protein
VPLQVFVKRKPCSIHVCKKVFYTELIFFFICFFHCLSFLKEKMLVRYHVRLASINDIPISTCYERLRFSKIFWVHTSIEDHVRWQVYM